MLAGFFYVEISILFDVLDVEIIILLISLVDKLNKRQNECQN